MALESLNTLFKLVSFESRDPEVHGDSHEKQVAGRLGAVGSCICPEERQVRRYAQIGTCPPYAAVVLTLSATDVKRATEPASGAACWGQIRTVRVPTAKAWLDEGAGSLAVLAGAVECLLSGDGGSLAGVPFEQGDGGCQYQAGD